VNTSAPPPVNEGAGAAAGGLSAGDVTLEEAEPLALSNSLEVSLTRISSSGMANVTDFAGKAEEPAFDWETSIASSGPTT